MKKWSDYDDTPIYQKKEQLPPGGYILRVLSATEEKAQHEGESDIITIFFDIAEGEHENYFKSNYQSQSNDRPKRWKGIYKIFEPLDDGSKRDYWKKRRMKTIIEAFEDSNSNYIFDWEPESLKGKYIGGIFNRKEYNINGRRGFYTRCYSLAKVEDIRDGNFTIPPDTLLEPNADIKSNEFMFISDGLDEDLPFADT